MPPLATVGILSLGDMGVGIAKLLVANNFRVVTNATGRSQWTHNRATSASVSLLSSDIDLVQECDYILSIVPPRDALSISTRIARALNSAPPRPSSLSPLYYLDLNATSPLTAQKMASSFSGIPDSMARVLDGGIIGGPPHLKAPEASSSIQSATQSADASAASTANPSKPAEVEPTSQFKNWYRPSIVVSGPTPLASAPTAGATLATVLNSKHVHDTLGPATGLKMVFASLNKGFTALAIQAYATAEQLHVLPELQAHMEEYSPALFKRAEPGMVNMCPKAYRWVAEMHEIAETMKMFGGFSGKSDSLGAGGVDGLDSEVSGVAGGAEQAKGGDLFECIGEVYKFVAHETPLGQERIGERKMGTSAKDVARVCAENLKPVKHVES